MTITTTPTSATQLFLEATITNGLGGLHPGDAGDVVDALNQVRGCSRCCPGRPYVFWELMPAMGREDRAESTTRLISPTTWSTSSCSQNLSTVQPSASNSRVVSASLRRLSEIFSSQKVVRVFGEI